MAEGHEFVSLEEVPELAHSSMVREEGRYKGTVCRGDLALAKIETKRVLARQQYMRQQTSVVQKPLIGNWKEQATGECLSQTQVNLV